MVRTLSALMMAAALMAGPAMAQSGKPAEPIRQIAVYVTPYYNNDGKGGVQVAVDRALDRLLASNAAADVLKVRDMVAAKPAEVAPNTLMVLASRLYDVGQRDEAVFWFYVARYRFLTLVSVLDDGRLAEANTATRAFVELVGPAINGYAVCNLDKQAEAERRALAWVTVAAASSIWRWTWATASKRGRRAGFSGTVSLLRSATSGSRCLPLSRNSKCR